MSTEALFISEISKLKRRIIIRAVPRILLNAAVAFLAICPIVIIIEKAGLLKYDAYGSWYFFSIGFSLLVGLVITYLRKRNFLQILIDIDTRLKLQDRLSTAYEYQKFGKKSDLSDLLMEDAIAKLRQLNPRRLFPAKFSLLHLLFIFLFLLNAALFMGDFLLPVHKSMRDDRKKLEKISTLLQNYTESRSESQPEIKTRRHNVYSKKLADLNNKLNDRSITRDQLFTALDRLLKDVRGEQTRLADELGTKLNAAGIEEMSIAKIPALENLSADKLEKIKILLNRMLDNRIPDTINQDMETLLDLHRVDKLLSQIIDDINEDTFDTQGLAESEGNETQGTQYLTDLKKTHEHKLRSKTSDQFSSRKRDSLVPHRQPESDQSSRVGRDIQHEFGSHDEGYSSLAGRAKSSGKKKPSNELEKSYGPSMQDKMISVQVKNYLIHIRSLTAIGESMLKEEDIIRSYRQEIEAILQKEDIPSNYRTYIKNYFISLGLKTEEHANEFK